MDIEQPSKFWQELAQAHQQDLERYGVDTCKRHQALRYFTWRWNWASIRHSEQMRFLLKHSSPGTLLRCAIERADLSDRSWLGIDWPKRDRWLYAYATRLLWTYAAQVDTVGTTRLEEPSVGAPLPVRSRGRLISQDLANSAVEVTAINRALAGRRPLSILEIGAGYGRTAFALMHLFPEATYTVVDIDPALEICRWYLSQLFPSDRLRLLKPAEVAGVLDGSVDLILAISSLQEMTQEQVAGYVAVMDRVAAGGVVYLKQWLRWRNPADGIELTFNDYPIPTDWRPIFWERAPVQTDFWQAAWLVEPRP
jgi:putative sugar O-methyltransferase